MLQVGAERDHRLADDEQRAAQKDEIALVPRSRAPLMRKRERQVTLLPDCGSTLASFKVGGGDKEWQNE